MIQNLQEKCKSRFTKSEKYPSITKWNLSSEGGGDRQTLGYSLPLPEGPDVTPPQLMAFYICKKIKAKYFWGP